MASRLDFMNREGVRGVSDVLIRVKIRQKGRSGTATASGAECHEHLRNACQLRPAKRIANANDRRYTGLLWALRLCQGFFWASFVCFPFTFLPQCRI